MLEELAKESQIQRNTAEITPLAILPSEVSINPVSINPIRVLGHGRAAEARLVEIETEDGQRLRCVEKVFCPGLLTRLIYRICFQSAFAYQDSADAILAAYYRRRVVWALCRVFAPDTNIARPLYVRWDASSQAMVLASELVVGRGIMPQAADPLMIRRILLRTVKNGHSLPQAPKEEIAELLETMQRLEQMFIDSGLIGTGWQVSKRAIVATANLLRTDQGYVGVDLESGIPSVLVSTYLKAGFQLGSMPLFDDLDAEQFRLWLKRNRPRLTSQLSSSQLAQLNQDVENLILHTDRWKGSEPAMLRQPRRLLTNRFYNLYRQRIVESWVRRQIVDSGFGLKLLELKVNLFATAVYWLGWLPGKPGRFLQRCWAHPKYRQQLNRFCTDSAFRSQTIQNYKAHCIESWTSSQRLSACELTHFSSAKFGMHWLLSKTTTARAHRWLTDGQYRRDRLTRIGLLCLSPRFQSEYGRLVARRRISGWRKEQRLTTADVTRLSHQLDDPAMEEYVRGFGMHIGLKLLLPLLFPLKAVGAAAFVASGNPIYLLIALMALPILRTAVTVWRLMASGRPLHDFRDALVIGAMPTVGSLAFPLQMHSRSPELSTFLMRDFASQIGRWLPIYGGKDSRTEIAAIKSVNVVIELMDIWLKLVRSRPIDDIQSQTVAATQVTGELTASQNPWDQAAVKQLRLIAAELEFEEISNASGSTQSPVRKAA